MIDECVFCDNEQERREGYVLFESDNFYVKPARFGAVGQGHILLIPKVHIRCYGALPTEHDNEFLEVTDKTKQKLADAFSAPIASELGVYGQSVKHAHIHFFPSVADHYNIKSLVSAAPDNIRISQIDDLAGLKRIFEQEGEYVHIDENNQQYVLHTKGYEGEPVRLRDLFVKVTGLEELLNWKGMSEEYQKRNERWVRETVEALKE